MQRIHCDGTAKPRTDPIVTKFPMGNPTTCSFRTISGHFVSPQQSCHRVYPQSSGDCLRCTIDTLRKTPVGFATRAWLKTQWPGSLNVGRKVQSRCEGKERFFRENQPQVGTIAIQRLARVEDGTNGREHRWTFAQVGGRCLTRGGGRVANVFPGENDTVSGLPHIRDVEWLTRWSHVAAFLILFFDVFCGGSKGSKACITRRKTSQRRSNAHKI